MMIVVDFFFVGGEFLFGVVLLMGKVCRRLMFFEVFNFVVLMEVFFRELWICWYMVCRMGFFFFERFEVLKYRERILLSRVL